jgi:hypothetical protein
MNSENRKKKVDLPLIFYVNIRLKELRKTKNRASNTGWDCDVKIT